MSEVKQEWSKRTRAVNAVVIGAPVTKSPIGSTVNLAGARSLQMQTTFTYVGGGTKVIVFLQTSLDGGVTWFDVISQTFLLATAVKLSALTDAVALAASTVPGAGGTLADDTILNGVLGDLFRVIATTTGTYTGATTVTVDLVSKG
jgi:hypothetical protein